MPFDFDTLYKKVYVIIRDNAKDIRTGTTPRIGKSKNNINKPEGKI